MPDLIREVRRATLAHLKADATLTNLVPPARIYPSTTPANVLWPFMRFDGPSSLPLDGNCYAGATVTFLMHAFAKPQMQGAAMVETAEDYASRIGSAAYTTLHRMRLPLGSASIRLLVRSARVIRDGDEADAYHAILSVEARVLAD
jgi:hypothetical protein